MKNSVLEASTVLRDIQAHAERIANNEPQRFPEAASDGEYFPQGDIYIWWREKLFPQGVSGMPEGLERLEKFELQLANGLTQGARHVLDSAEGVTAFRRVKGDALQGLILVTTAERVITHPEHGHVVLPPSSTEYGTGAYEITFQRAYADVLRAVRD